jgi:uncharacterized protein (TIGR03790 family)
MSLQSQNSCRQAVALATVLLVFLSEGCKEQSATTTATAGNPPAVNVPLEGISKPAVSSPPMADAIQEHVLVLENANSPTSVQIAKYYMEKRGVKKILRIRCPDSAKEVTNETLEYGLFLEAIEKPLREYLANDAKIDYIVLNKGIPIRLSGAPVGLSNNRPSLDSFIAALDYFERPNALKVVIDEGGFTGRCFVNRYFNSQERYAHSKHGGYLVTRLDGYTMESAMALVDNSLAGERSRPTGTIFLDAMPLAEPIDSSKVPMLPVKNGQTDMQMISGMGFAEWNLDLFAAADNLSKAGKPVEFDRTENFIGDKKALMGYASWGSNDAKFIAANYQSIRFAPGAIAETAVSTSGRTFLPTTGGQSLIADLIEARVTGAKGYCDEPFLPAIASPTILFDRYTRGWNLAESFYAASRFVGWEDIVLGDPLSAPYAKR